MSKGEKIIYFFGLDDHWSAHIKKIHEDHDIRVSYFDKQEANMLQHLAAENCGKCWRVYIHTDCLYTDQDIWPYFWMLQEGLQDVPAIVLCDDTAENLEEKKNILKRHSEKIILTQDASKNTLYIIPRETAMYGVALTMKQGLMIFSKFSSYEVQLMNLVRGSVTCSVSSMRGALCLLCNQTGKRFLISVSEAMHLISTFTMTHVNDALSTLIYVLLPHILTIGGGLASMYALLYGLGKDTLDYYYAFDENENELEGLSAVCLQAGELMAQFISAIWPFAVGAVSTGTGLLWPFAVQAVSTGTGLLLKVPGGVGVTLYQIFGLLLTKKDIHDIYVTDDVDYTFTFFGVFLTSIVAIYGGVTWMRRIPELQEIVTHGMISDYQTYLQAPTRRGV